MDNNSANSSTYQYWDFMDGNAMVCSSLGPSEYRVMCIYFQYVLGVVILAQGLWLLYNAMRLGRLPFFIAPESKAPSSRVENASKRELVGKRARTLYFKRITYVFGLEYVALGSHHLIGGNSTVYPASAIAGIFGDFFFGVTIACFMYHSLLQLRGAVAFRNLIQLPDDAIQKRMNATWMIDFAQGACAFPITFGFWLMLAIGVITRPQCYAVYFFLLGAVVVRSMFKDVLSRVRTLARINELQQNAGGDLGAKQRRRKTLIKKLRALILHVVSVTTFVVFFLSIISFGTVNSSTQYLIHIGTTNTFLAIFGLLLCLATNKHVSRICFGQASLTRAQTKRKLMSSVRGTGDGSKLSKTDEPQSKYVYTVADESGLSVIQDSEIEFGRKKPRGSSSELGLFDDVESNL